MTKVLKVYVKGLAAEAIFSRIEERKSLLKARTFKINAKREEQDEETRKDDERSRHYYEQFWGLHHHRTHVLRKEARHALLAYGFIRGKKYSQLEDSDLTKSTPDWKAVSDMVIEFTVEDPRTLLQQFERWVQEATGVAEEEKKVA